MGTGEERCQRVPTRADWTEGTSKAALDASLDFPPRFWPSTGMFKVRLRFFGGRRLRLVLVRRVTCGVSWFFSGGGTPSTPPSEMCELYGISRSMRLDYVDVKFRNILSRKRGLRGKVYIQVCPKKDDQINFLYYLSSMSVFFVAGRLS